MAKRETHTEWICETRVTHRTKGVPEGKKTKMR